MKTILSFSLIILLFSITLFPQERIHGQVISKNVIVKNPQENFNTNERISNFENSRTIVNIISFENGFLLIE